jgi:hypothetical protein
MNCATHPDIAAVAFCRTCGKPLCGNCTRDVRGVVYCEPCLAARLEGTVPPAAFVPAQATNYPPPGAPFTPGAPLQPMRGSGPNPAVAGILAGFFPFGVGAVYCSQYAKGLAHLIIFVMLIFGSDHAGRLDFVFGIGIAFFYVYQIIDAVRTARALQEGLPAPDPMGLAQTFSMGEKFDTGKVPVGAVILIGLGVLFLLHTMNIFEFGLDRFWPVLLILFGGWMFARHWGAIPGRRFGCACDRCRMRRITGPAIIVTIGVLLLLQSLDMVGFDRTWPAILLVIGVVKLLQSNASSAGHTGRWAPIQPGAAPPPGPPPPVTDPGTTPSSGEVRNV